MEKQFGELPNTASHHPSNLLPSVAAYGGFAITSDGRRDYDLDIADDYQIHPYAASGLGGYGFGFRHGYGGFLEPSSLSGSRSRSISRTPSPTEDDPRRWSSELEYHRSPAAVGLEELGLIDKLQAMHVRENITVGCSPAPAGAGTVDPYSSWVCSGGASMLRRSVVSDPLLLDRSRRPPIVHPKVLVTDPRSFSNVDFNTNGGLNPSFYGTESRDAAVDTLLAESNLLCQTNGVHLNPTVGLLNSQGSMYELRNKLHYGFPILNEGANALANKVAVQHPVRFHECEDSFIMQGKGVSFMGCNWNDLRERRSQTDNTQTEGSHTPRFAAPLPDKKGTIYHLARDQHGCRFLQRKFDERKAEEITVIFDGVIDHVVELMENPFGNYLMQKLLDVCSFEQRMMIILMLTKNPSELVRISLNTHGTRAVQKLIETLKTRQEILLITAALKSGLLKLIKDPNGNHVVQRCLVCLTPEENKFIFDAATKYCVDIATHRHGCCVLQSCILQSTGEDRIKLVNEISANSLLLALDAFGNYVVQYIFDHLDNQSARANLISQFEGNYEKLSKNKYSSNVVEKCLKFFGDDDRARIILELLSVPKFEELLQDQYANYVIQSALLTTKGHLNAALVEAIRPHATKLRSNPYSKRICSRTQFKK